ncbi:MAG: hypothetical protein SAJ37_07175 [Oscillatoria sp. PMC 1068.18]|nr:hypothetical protein [Oscillatoria sp. PMC 1076.18]MEC4988514.1 hypothetical protein [Oscillatoria sp. PMC 1068.18]
MYNFGIENKIPSPPSRRKKITEQFSTLLTFSPSTRRQISQWVADTQLEKNFLTLLKIYPDWEEKVWLAYFLKIVLNSSNCPTEKEIARKHLWAYYQEVCFWTTRKYCRSYSPDSFQWKTLSRWDWEDIFYHAGATFSSVDQTVKDLHNFKPEISAKEYIKIISKRNLSKWIDKEIAQSKLITLDNDRDEENSHQTKINQYTEEQSNAKKENLIAKKQQNQVIATLRKELTKVELEALTTNPQTTVGKAKIPCWTVLLLNYGLNLKQQLTANILTANQLPIDQSNISRFLNNFCLKISLKILVSLPENLKDTLDLTEAQEQIEKQAAFQVYVKQNKNKVRKELDELLREYCNSWLLQTIVKLDPETKTQPSLRVRLTSWFHSTLHINLDRNQLKSDLVKVNKKIDLVVTSWAEKLSNLS